MPFQRLLPTRSREIKNPTEAGQGVAGRSQLYPLARGESKGPETQKPALGGFRRQLCYISELALFSAWFAESVKNYFQATMPAAFNLPSISYFASRSSPCK